MLRRFSDEIEERGLAEAVELGAAFCFEQCDRGPNVQINGQEFHGVREEDVPGLLRRALAGAGVSEAVSA